MSLLRITRSKIWENRSGEGLTRFMMRTAKWGGESSDLLMTLQGISGSDYFHPVQFSRSQDRGESWSEPEFIPALGRVPAPNGTEEGVCDVQPEYHPQTDRILAIGHTVFYRENRLYDSLSYWGGEDDEKCLQRRPAYVVGNRQGEWSETRKPLVVDAFRECSIYTCGSAQRITLADGSLIIPFTYSFFDRRDRRVCTMRCHFDGETVTAGQQGNSLELLAGRGLLEPSLSHFGGRFYMTLRAEDDHGYLSVSDDGLTWGAIKPWGWNTGEPLTMASTQQHWLALGGRLYLVYTRKADENINVMRWRAPIYIAEVDTDRLCLKRQTEQIVFPLQGDGVDDPEGVGMMGNFNVVPLDDQTALAHVGEMLPWRGYVGDSLQAVLRVENGVEPPKTP